MPGLPLFCFTRFSAALALPRWTTSSIRRSVPGRLSPFVAGRASPLRWHLGASPLPSSGSASCLAFWCMARPRLTVVSPSCSFGPSRRRGPRTSGRRSPSRVWLPRPLLRPLLTSRSALLRRRPFGREARSPQVRVVAFTARPPDLRRRVVGRESFAVNCPLALLGSASYPVPVRRLAVSLPASFSTSLTVGALRFARGPCDRVPQRTFTSKSRPCWAHIGIGGSRRPERARERPRRRLLRGALDDELDAPVGL